MEISGIWGDAHFASAISPDLRTGIENLGFEQPLESEFREAHLERNLLRARISTTIYLALLGVISMINLIGGLVPAREVLSSIFVIRAGVLGPALVTILAVTYIRSLRAYYQPIIGFAIVVAGIAVMSITAMATTAALPQFGQMGNVLVVVYGCLFVGLLFKFVLTIATLLVAAFFVTGFAAGIPSGNLAFGGAMLTAAALMTVLSALRVERLMRTTFVETRLLNDAAQRDGLTGLFNRRAFDTLTQRLWRQARREAAPVQFLLIDIDWFKEYNDRYGHQAGDDCLRKIANIIARSANRPFDFCARYGGEEFA